MRRTPSLVGLLSLIGLLVACLATRSLSQEARSQDDSEADLRSFAALRQRLTTVEQTQPAQAVAQYRQFVTAHPHLDPATAILVADTMAQLLYNRVRDVAAALAAYQETYARYQAAPSSLSLLTEQAKLLIAEARASEAQALVEAHWNATLRAEPALSSALLLQYARALKQQGKHDELITGLETALMASPALLDDGAQSQPRPGSPGSDAALLNGLGWGWMYAQLVDELLARGRVEEALSWAKVRFVTCSIQNGATDRAARMWAKVWTVKDPSQVTAQACVRAQQDPLAPNPLVMVVLPLGEERVRRGATSPSAATLSPAALSNVALLSTDPNQSGSSQAASDLVTSAHRTISLHLVRGAYVPAMVAACQLLAAQPDAPDGVLEVARVFKAVDLNLKRSNAFIAFFKTGQGDNPLQDFFRNQPPPAGQLPAAARSVTQLAGQGNPVFGTDELAITVPFLISQLRAGTMKAEAAWQTGVLTPDEVAYMLTWGGIVDGEGQIENKKLRTNLAGLL
ncbi:MAG: hypothetical protein JOZ57_06360, partial [Abitibacteriaceae bacterium]|nr:hypothetical protein [Abditibacteriaceae bacterium]